MFDGQKLNTNKIYYYSLILLFTVSSYVALLPTTFLDDIIVICVGLVALADMICSFRKIERPIAIAVGLILFEIIYFIVSLFVVGNRGAVVSSFASFIKIAFLLMICFTSRGFKEREIKLQNIFFIISIPNIIRGGYEFFYTYIFGGYLAGKYEQGIGYRIQGFVGHPIYFSLLMVMCVMYLLYFSKKRWKFLGVVVCSLLCIYTWSSFALILLVLLIGNYFLHALKVATLLEKYSKSVFIVTVIGAIGAMVWFMIREPYTIRSVSMTATIKNLNLLNLFIGEGFGTFSMAGLGEAYIFHVLYENGIVGLLVMLIPLVFMTKKLFKSRNYVGLFLVGAYIVNIFINEGYLLPFIIYIPAICAMSKEEKENSR